MRFASFSINQNDLPREIKDLRAEVRAFLAAERSAGRYARTPEGWDRYDPAFTRRIAERGWIGMTWPALYGGAERSSLERYIVTEELLTAGAPVRAHWLADRQIGPLLLAYGTEAQKLNFLPRIAAGGCFFCAGLSEPDSGSDLSSIRTRAARVDGGWLINGSKVWTSYAHKAHYMNLFARTSPRDEQSRHAGLSQIIVDLKSPGITIRPIINIAGDHDFNEVVLENVHVADDCLIGEVGGAWKQVSAELAHERAGPERWVNSYSALVAFADEMGNDETDLRASGKADLGRLVAHIWALHRMSFSIASMLQHGHTPTVEAALAKDLGTTFDQEVPAVARGIMTESLRARMSPAKLAMLDRALLYAPSNSIRGGTREILRGIIARGLGLR